MTFAAKLIVSLAILFGIFASAVRRSIRTEENESWDEISYNIAWFIAVPVAIAFIAYVIAPL